MNPMKTTTINVTPRGNLTKGQMKDMRKDGLLPANISIRGQDAVSISIRRDELQKFIQRHGTTSVVQLAVEGEKSYTAMVREIQSAPLTREWLHVTFQYVSMSGDHRQRADPAQWRDTVAHKGFESNVQLDALEVRGLPGDLPQAIEVDVSEMEAGDTLFVRDLPLPEGITALTEEDRLVFSVSHPRVAEGEEVAAEETGDEADAAPRKIPKVIPLFIFQRRPMAFLCAQMA